MRVARRQHVEPGLIGAAVRREGDESCDYKRHGRGGASRRARTGRKGVLPVKGNDAVTHTPPRSRPSRLACLPRRCLAFQTVD